MKKRFWLFVLLCFGRTGVASAEYTNVVTGEYATSEEYLKNKEALTAIGADKAYTGSGGAYKGFSGKNVTVAIVDNGTFLNHEDLKNNISTLGQTDFNVVAYEHGTHVAGIIAAEKSSNNIGIHGVAYGASVLPFSVLLENACALCMSPQKALEVLSKDEYDAVKIINNSWGGELSEGDITSAQKLVAKDKLIVASAGNEMNLSPVGFPAGAAKEDGSLKNNLFSVVAYDPLKTPDDDHFIAGYSNLAVGAQSWTLAAPGTFYSSVVYDPAAVDPAKYKSEKGTSMATAVVSGAAALVQEAFPSIGGKQIADILLSTAFKKEDLPALSPYMIQEEDAKKRFLFFTDNGQGMTYEDALTAAGITCSGTTECNKVTFEDVFGQGLLNAGDAVKGPKYFDAERLSAQDYDSTLKQFFYTVNTTDTTEAGQWRWSNDISQKVITDNQSEYANKNIGLKKKGAGTLILSGDNSFSGTSVVEEGSLVVQGSLGGSVIVRDKFSVKDGVVNGDVVVNAENSGAGFFFSDGGTVTGNVNVKEGTSQVYAGTVNGGVTVASGGLFKIDDNSGVDGGVNNQGTVWAGNATVTGDFVNAGIFQVSGKVADTVASQKNFNLTGGMFTNNKTVLFDEKGGFSGTLENNSRIQVTGDSQFQGRLNNTAAGNVNVEQGKTLAVTSGAIENHGSLTGAGTIDGIVNNASEGSVQTSLTIGTLNSAGRIVLQESDSSPVAMNVNTLNITGGGFALSNENKTFHDGESYTVITFNSLTAFDNFEQQTKLSDFIVARPVLEAHEIQAKIEFLRMSEVAASTFSTDERKVLQAVDKMYGNQNKTDFNRFYFYTTDEVKKQVEVLRSKVQPVQNEQLPLTKVMASQVYAHLFTNNVINNASDVRQPYVPMQRYQGRYYRGRSGGHAPDNQKIWGQFLGGIFKEDGNASLNQGDLTTRSVGAMFGYDYEFSDKFLLGVTFGAASAHIKQDDSKTGLRDYRAGVYTASRFGRVTFNTVMMGGLQKYNSERHLQLLGTDEVGKAKYDGYSAEFDANLGYDFMQVPYRDYSFYLRSYLAANVNYIHQDAYKEEGNSFLALGVKEMHDTSVSVSPGVTLGYTFSRMVLTADVGYQRILSGGKTHASAYFLADTEKTAFSSLPADTDKDFFNIGLGMKTNLTQTLQLNLWAGARKSKKTEALNLSATLSYDF